MTLDLLSHAQLRALQEPDSETGAAPTSAAGPSGHHQTKLERRQYLILSCLSVYNEHKYDLLFFFVTSNAIHLGLTRNFSVHFPLPLDAVVTEELTLLTALHEITRLRRERCHWLKA